MFLASNLLKVPDGGYVPLLIASAMVLIMCGPGCAGPRSSPDSPATIFRSRTCSRGLEVNPPHTVKGTAIFFTAEPETAPTALLHNLKHNKVLHERNLVLTVKAIQEPYVADDAKVVITELAPNLTRLVMSFGYMETPNVTRGLQLAKKQGLAFDIMHTSFFLSRRTLLAEGKRGMPLWQDHLFIFLSRNATTPTEFFRIPTSRGGRAGDADLDLSADSGLFCGAVTPIARNAGAGLVLFAV